MRSIKKIQLLVISFFVLTIISCKKTPGQGGNAIIRGKVWVKEYDPFFTVILGEYYDPNANVMITFGDNVSPDETIKTNANGEFEFQYMRKGKYTISLYSHVLKDSLHPSGLVSVDTTITIVKSRDVIDVGTLKIQK